MIKTAATIVGRPGRAGGLGTLKVSCRRAVFLRSFSLLIWPQAPTPRRGKGLAQTLSIVKLKAELKFICDVAYRLGPGPRATFSLHADLPFSPLV